MLGIFYTKSTLNKFDAILDLTINADPQYPKKSVSKWTKDNLILYPNLQFMALYNEKVIGAISVSGEEKYLSIDDLSVDAGFQNQHVGSKLVALVENEAKQTGYTICRLLVHPTNKKVIAFYHALGYHYREDIESNNMDGIPDHEKFLMMEKEL